MNGDQPFRMGGRIGQEFDERRRTLAAMPQVKLFTPPPPAPRTPDDPEYLVERLRERMQRDLRHPARAIVDLGWESIQVDAMKRFGRKVPVDPWNIADAGVRVALEHAGAAEDDYLAVAMSVPPPSREMLDASLAVFTAAVTAFLNRATAGWLSAAEKACADEQRARVW